MRSRWERYQIHIWCFHRLRWPRSKPSLCGRSSRGPSREVTAKALPSGGRVGAILMACHPGRGPSHGFPSRHRLTQYPGAGSITARVCAWEDADGHSYKTGPWGSPTFGRLVGIRRDAWGPYRGGDSYPPEPLAATSRFSHGVPRGGWTQPSVKYNRLALEVRTHNKEEKAVLQKNEQGELTRRRQLPGRPPAHCHRLRHGWNG